MPPTAWRSACGRTTPSCLIDRAAAAGSAGWFDKAVADLDRVLQADPSRLDALIYRASANRALGRLDPAMADVEAALKLAPDSAPALLERGNIRSLRGEIDGGAGGLGAGRGARPRHLRRNRRQDQHRPGRRGGAERGGGKAETGQAAKPQ